MRCSTGARWIRFLLACVALGSPITRLEAAETFRVATYNLCNYGDEKLGNRPLKTDASKAMLRQSIKLLQADVLAVQEVVNSRSFTELQQSLKTAGTEYPYSELLFGWDTNVHVGVLSKFPITSCRRHTNDTYLLTGKRRHVERGFLEIDVKVSEKYRFTALVAHLKSRREIVDGDQAEMRLQEAQLLREKVNALLETNPRANIVVLGDLNDVKDSAPIRAILGRYKNALKDSRPAEPNGDDTPAQNSRWDPPSITWTHFYGKEDTYSRIDYILLSPGMEREWIKEQTRVLAMPNWGLASDHRPIVAAFRSEDQ